MDCRACGAPTGEVILDLGEQPACDYFPLRDDPGPDPVHPLQMWLCAVCGLAQLVADPTVPEEPRGAEPAALVEQAADAISRVVTTGWISAGTRVAEYDSPHGGSWLPMLGRYGALAAGSNQRADVVLDCFGMMHSADQAGAIRDRAARTAPGGLLLLQYHSLATIIGHSQWNSLRHGHYAYYSTTALTTMLCDVGFRALMAWHFGLYGGTVLLAAVRDDDVARAPDNSVADEIAREAALGVRNPSRLRQLQHAAEASATALHDWLAERRAAGANVVGYGAASRAVALLCRAAVDSSLLPAVADASAAKQGRRMPGTDIPVIAPQEFVAAQPSFALLFLPDLLPEVRRSFPEIEAAGGSWVNIDDMLTGAGDG